MKYDAPSFIARETLLKSETSSFGRRLTCFGISALTLSACAPPGQRLFDAQAGKRPTPPVKHGETAPVAPPFLQFTGTTSRKAWAPVVYQSVKFALARRPEVLFQVQAILPLPKTVAEQASEMRKNADGTMRGLAEVMRSAGAESSQIMVSIRVDPSVDHLIYRVDPR